MVLNSRRFAPIRSAAMPGNVPNRVAFGTFELDLQTGELQDGERRVILQRQPFEILVMLAEKNGRLVTREEIKKRLWPNDTIVEFESSIATAIKKLRKELGDSPAAPKYIQTIPRRGYRLIPTVETFTSQAESRTYLIRPTAESRGPSPIGKKVSHYRVLEIIGGGGMGLVYRAEDLKLGRRVALKFLPEELADDPVALRRFEREARTTSSLNHPNICSIHEFGEHEGQPFLVMELLDGQTLRDRLAELAAGHCAVPLNELLTIAMHVAEGLEAAHEQGIIHRDIKPANIFLTKNGTTKILDFGIAKLAEAAIEEGQAVFHATVAADHQREPAEYTLTRTGSAMGTAGYMSPEQVRGEKLDARTDLFSFGLVLYEMATGQRAFFGETAAILKEAILNDTPISVREVNSNIPSKLVTTIDKALEKDRAKRYQKAAEMRTDLTKAASGLSLPSPLRGRDWKLAAAIAALGIAASAALFLASHRPSSPPLQIKQTQLTANSAENEVEGGVISPDGRYLSYTDLRGTHFKLLETGATTNLSGPPELNGLQVNWGARPLSATKFLAGSSIPGQPDSAWTVSVMDGIPRKLRDDAAYVLASPDGSTIAFLRDNGREGYREIWLMDVNGEHERKIYEVDEDTGLDIAGWSPDSRRLLYTRNHRSGDKVENILESRDLKGGPPTTAITDPRLWTCSWLPGRIIYSLRELDSSGLTCNLREMRVDYNGNPNGISTQLTNWPGFCVGELTATADGKKLVTNKWRSQGMVYVAEASGKPNRLTPRRLTLSDARERLVGWTPDGKAIIFISDRDGKWGIFKQTPGEEFAQTVLGHFEDEDRPEAAISPDGEWILYQHFSKGAAGSLMRVPISGGTSQLLLTLSTPEAEDWWSPRERIPPRCARLPAQVCVIAERSDNGHKLIFTAFDPTKGRGKELVRLEVEPTSAYKMDVSPDGTRLAVLKRSEHRIQIFSMNGQPVSEIVVAGWKSLESLDWAADGKGLFVSGPRDGKSALLHIDLRGKATILWEQAGEQAGGLDVYARPSPDGHHLAMFGWSLSSNMWMLENF